MCEAGFFGEQILIKTGELIKGGVHNRGDIVVIVFLRGNEAGYPPDATLPNKTSSTKTWLRPEGYTLRDWGFSHKLKTTLDKFCNPPIVIGAPKGHYYKYNLTNGGKMCVQWNRSIHGQLDDLRSSDFLTVATAEVYKRLTDACWTKDREHARDHADKDRASRTKYCSAPPIRR